MSEALLDSPCPHHLLLRAPSRALTAGRKSISWGFVRRSKDVLWLPRAAKIRLLLTPAPGITLERAIQFIKGGYSHALGVELGRKSEVWQRGFADHRIRDAADLDIHRNCIHENPAKRGIVREASNYRYCSAFPGFKLNSWPSAAEAA